MSSEPSTIRLGGMALANGVLVHGPTSWACSVRLADGAIKTATGVKPRIGRRVAAPVVRGPARLIEAFALLPVVRRRLPEARFAFERPAVAAAAVGTSVVVGALRRSRLSPGLREVAVGFASLVPALTSLRGGEVTSYHGAEHVSIGTYEQGGERAPKEHDRCGSHLVGPLLVTSAAANALAARAPVGARSAARLAGTVTAVGVSIETLAWMGRNPDHPVARLLARPGHALQARLSTSDPSPDQLEVAETALCACLELEQGRGVA